MHDKINGYITIKPYINHFCPSVCIIPILSRTSQSLSYLHLGSFAKKISISTIRNISPHQPEYQANLLYDPKTPSSITTLLPSIVFHFSLLISPLSPCPPSFQVLHAYCTTPFSFALHHHTLSIFLPP